ncbi:MAG: histidine--tRNA ligase [Actinomycetota bacterium]|nr:histidine--tRNA ligase [Actinomycetota bacterium]
MEFSPPRGTSDLLPPASEQLRALADMGARRAELYGYRSIETPAFEQTELFARTSGESSDLVRKEMYTFEDKGGRSLTLRPEGTAPVVRAFLDRRNDVSLPFKTYYLEAMWRYGRPQAGRLREFRQFGIECIGAPEPEADIEVILVGDEYLRETGLDRLELQLNSIGDAACRPAYREELLEYLERNRERLVDEHRAHFRANPMRVLDCKDAACREVAAGAPKISDRLCQACKEHFEGVRDGLAQEGVTFVHVPTLVRGLDYYTRTTFEWVSHVLSEGQATVGGGGRYDGLAEVLGGPATPGIGFALGLERILLALQTEGKDIGGAGLRCFVVAIGDAARPYANDLSRRLRAERITTGAAFGSRPLKAQLRMADRAGATFAVIIGDKEAAAETVKIRRLADGHEEEFGLDEAIVWIRTEGAAEA